MPKLLYSPAPKFRPRSMPTPQTGAAGVAADESSARRMVENVLFVVAAACVLITLGLQILSLSRATGPRPVKSASVGLRAT